MISWKMHPGCHKAAAESFLSSGAPMPAGLESLGRWHAPGSAYGWVLVQGNDPVVLAHHMAEWGDFLDLQVTPVLDDAEAASGLSKVYGK
jgi:hypothetical protein